ncbi:MAG TPA: VOC family protein [Jatrophihabitantaceae bacterium]|nr:VOC family protein [Jatrophihabitantaceae bacterium]
MDVRWLTAFLDCPHPELHPTVEFWSAVTGFALSPWRGEGEQFATLVPRTGDAYLRVQDVHESVARVHLDLHVDDPPALAAHGLSLGAVDVTEGDVPSLRSPAGIVWCAVEHAGETQLPDAAVWPSGRSQVDQVCLDIPPSKYAPEVTFWRELTGWAWIDSGTEFQRLDGPAGTMRLLMQRLDDEAPDASAHLDIASTDRSAEAQRHIALGARHLYEGRGWSTLADPTGRRYCITGREPRRLLGAVLADP